MPAESFYAPITESPREDQLQAYLTFLEKRNGTLDPTQPYPHREEWLKGSEQWQARHRGEIDPQAFDASWQGLQLGADSTPEEHALLAFVKMNAGEAYGVEVVSRMRHGRKPGTALFDRVERVISNEETYHTRILVGATRQFGLEPPKGAWKPPASLKVLIGTLAYSPKAIFHPVLLGAEISGVFTFNWMLERVRVVFRDQPEVRDTMEQRLLEILIDEIGHIAFNRLAVGPWGLATARRLGGQVAKASTGMFPEYAALGFDKEALRAFDRFDYTSLPEEARRNAFFV